jgi:hypothetical protein
MSQRSRVKDYIESKAVFLAEATADFIRTPSISGAEGEIARLLLKRMGEMGIEAKADAIGNVLGWVKGGGHRRIPRDSHSMSTWTMSPLANGHPGSTTPIRAGRRAAGSLVEAHRIPKVPGHRCCLPWKP